MDMAKAFLAKYGDTAVDDLVKEYLVGQDSNKRV
jgi:hypothetical protein